MIEFDVTVHRRTAVPAELDDARIEKVVQLVLAAESADGDWTVGVVFVDDAEMQRMHRDFMGLDEPTDIMTFPTDPEEDGTLGGDLIISADTAAANAAEHGQTTAQELEFLIAHGMLHLLGWDDQTPDERAAMLARQTEILGALA